MRRDEVNGPSQPVRNLLGNPSGEATTASTTILETNLFSNPQAETIGANWTVRTNLAIDPRQTTPGSLGPYGAQTFTPVTGLVGAPNGITTAARVTYTGAANPGPILMLIPKFATRYTLTAYVYHETVGTNATQGFALKGVTANSLPITQGVWERVSWTYTTPASGFGSGNDFGFRVTGQTSGGSYLITGVQIEESAYVNPYYDGLTPASGDFNYAWTGTPHASTSVMSGKIVASFGNPSSNRASVVSSTEWADKGTRSVRIIPGQATDGTTNASYAEIAINGLTIGRTYYVTAVNRIAQPLTGTLASDHRRLFYPGTQPTNMTVYSGVPVNTAGNVYNLVASFTASATFHNIRLQNGAPEGPNNDVWWDSVKVSDGASDYFDGSTAAGNDFTYTWAGAANASASYKRGLLVPGVNSSGNAGVIQSTLWSSSGTKSIRIMNLGPTTIAEGLLTSDIGVLRPGFTYTVLGKLRIDAIATTSHERSRRFIFYVSTNGGGNYVSNYGTQAPNVVGVHDMRYTFTVPVNATNVILRMGGSSFGAVNAAVNADAWWDDLMLVEGVYEGDYVDGTKSFSKWDGTPNSSTSVGYPPQLLDIAGKPSVDVTGNANTGFIAVDPYVARTFYVVYESFGNTASYNSTFNYGIIGNKGFSNQTGSAGTNSIVNRMDFPNGTFNKSLSLANGRAIRRHVAAYSFVQGLTSINACLNGGGDQTTTMSPGDGWDDGRVVTSSGTEIRPIRALVFYADHDRATRLAISRYLGNKYGALVA